MRNWIKRTRNSIILLSLTLLMAVPVFALPLGRVIRGGLAPAQLVFPTSDSVDLRGKEYLEFKWILHNLISADYTDLRIYKSYNTYGVNLILKERISSGGTSFRVKTSMFENNQVYTWVLKVVSRGGEKSDSVYNSFKVIK